MTAPDRLLHEEAQWLAASMSCPGASWSFPQTVGGPLEVRNQFEFSFTEHAPTELTEQTPIEIIFSGNLELKLLNADTSESIGHANFTSRLEVLLMESMTVATIRDDYSVRKEFTEFCVALSVGYLRTLVIQASTMSGTEFQIVLPPISLPLIGDLTQIVYHPSTLV